MASSVDARLQDPGYKRFILANIACDWLCEQLAPYTQHIIEGLHEELIRNGHTTPGCHTSTSTFRQVKECLVTSCGSSVRLLDSYHIKGSVHYGWNNSQIELWQDQPWSLALLYMNSGQNPVTNSGPADTDISGFLSLMLNCTQFAVERTLVTNIRDRRNLLVHHKPGFVADENELCSLLDDIQKLLVDKDVNRHVKVDITAYVNEVKCMKLNITPQDQMKIICQIQQECANAWVEFSRKYTALHKVLTDAEHKIKKNAEDICQLEKHTIDNTREIDLIKRAISTNSEPITTHAGSGPSFEHIKQELVKCYSRPEYTQLSPLLDDETFGKFIESVFVEVSVVERIPTTILGKSGLEDSIKQQGKHVRHISEMIPAPGKGHRVLVTGFVGSGKTSLCLYFIHQWVCKQCDAETDADTNVFSEMHKYEIVIFLRARALEINICQSVANVLFGEQGKVDQDSIRMVADVLSSQASTLIIVDGYDEATAQQKIMVDELACYKTMPKASVIITSRPNFFHGKISKWYDNLGFKREQQIVFMNKYKQTIIESQLHHFEKFQNNFMKDQNASNLFTSPMIAMTTCTMVAAGEDVHLDSRVQNYTQLTDFLIRRACSKFDITPENVAATMPAFMKTTYIHMVEANAFYFSREDLLCHISSTALDNIIIRLGVLSVTKYILSSSKIDYGYTFVHKSWAEFIAARYVMSLPIAASCKAVCDVFMSGPANMEILRFVFGICSRQDPRRLVRLVRAILDLTGALSTLQPSQMGIWQKLKLFNKHQQTQYCKQALAQEKEEVLAITFHDVRRGSAYLLLLFVDVHLDNLPTTVLAKLSQLCAAIKRARIEEDMLGNKVKGTIAVSRTDRLAAISLYVGILLTGLHAQQSLPTLRELRISCKSDSPYYSVSRLPATLAECAPNMTKLVKLEVRKLTSITDLGNVCKGLAASGLPCLTDLALWGAGDLTNVAGGDLAPMVCVISKARLLRELEIQHIHVGEDQMKTLCEALGQAVPHLTHLRFSDCSVTAQHYHSMLLPALRERRCLDWLRIERKEEDGGSKEEWDALGRELGAVVNEVGISKY